MRSQATEREILLAKARAKAELERRRAMRELPTLTFERFLDEVLHVAITRAQRVMVRVMFDDANPGEFEGEDRELARQLFGAVDVVPQSARHVVALLKGARMGGTWLWALYLLYRALTADLSGLQPGELAFAPIVAPDLDTAEQGLRYAAGAAHSSRRLGELIAGETKTSLLLRRPDGHGVSIETRAATRGGSAVRGRTMVAALMDESAFFRDASSGVVNDTEIARALKVRVIPGGKLGVVSTAFLEAGELWTLIEQNHPDHGGEPTGALACIAPTLTMRPNDPKLAQVVAEERQRDPLNAAREFDCKALSGGAELLFDRAALRAAVDEHLALPLEHTTQRPAYAGGDLGFVSDCAALVVVRRYLQVVKGAPTWMFEVAAIDEDRPEPGSPLKPSVVIGGFAKRAKSYRTTGVWADGHYRESHREHLEEHDLMLLEAPEGQPGKQQVYMAARVLIHGGRVRLPNHPRLLAQLREVIRKPLPGGGFRVMSPRKGVGQGHGDIVSAFVLALHAAWAESEELGTGEAFGERAFAEKPPEEHRPGSLGAELSRLTTGGGSRGGY